jgi:iron complex transport system permease protein
VVLLFALSIAVGSVYIPLGAVWGTLTGNADLPPVWHTIVWESRLPRAITASLAGAALAVAGLLMQTLFRNPLAGPSVLGLSSGAGLAVAMVTLLPWAEVPGKWTLTTAAILGAMAVLALVLAVAHRFRDVASVLIVGLMLSFFSSAVVGVLQAKASEASLKAFVMWGFGTFGKVERGQLWQFGMPLLLALIYSPALIRALNALLPGELHARTVGVHVPRTRRSIMLITGVLTGVVTAWCGPVAFVGLAAPHLARFTFRTVHHAVILPGAVLWGSALALAADIIARQPGTQQSLPLNTVCAMLGAPVVVYLIFAARKKNLLL